MTRPHPTGLRTLGRWAVCVLLLAALLPTVGRWLQARAAAAAPWDVVCTVADGATPAGDHGVPGGEHCPWCPLQAAQPAWPPVDDRAPVLRGGLSHALPRLFLQAPSTLAVWRSAQARAPPRG